jgi:hypothetical protein
MKHLRSILTALALLPSLAHADSNERALDFGPIENLPAAIKATPGKLTLVPDGDTPLGTFGFVYLINASTSPISLSTVLGGVACTRETRDVNGVWQRCDPQWPDRMECGNVEGEKEVPAGSFFRFPVSLHSEKGELKTIRFRLDHDPSLISSEFQARVDPAGMELCRFDLIGIQTAPFEDVAAAATGRHPGNSTPWRLLFSLRYLHRFDSDPRLLGVIKEITRQAREQKSAPDPKLAEFAAQRYREALVLAETQPASTKDFVAFVRAEFRDPNNPFRNDAFAVFLRNETAARRKTLLEEIITTPTHPALTTALEYYSQIVGQKTATPRLLKISKDPRYPTPARELAGAQWKSLTSQQNPPER